jgi:hypothetical protein
MGLAALLIPLIPGLVQGVLAIVQAIRDHEDTPDTLKTRLDAISSDLVAINKKVQDVALP